jgi:hypothetical protein
VVQDFTAFRKISFQTVDVEVALAEIEYQYLKFVCEATLRNSDEVLREQIRHLHIAGLPSFDDWRKQDTAQALLLPAIETNTIPTTAIESQDAPIETIAEPVVKPDGRKKNGRKPSESTATAKATKAKPSTNATASSATPGSATEKLISALSDQATAKLTSRTVIEQQHELLSAVLKEGKSYDDLAEILTSHGAKISASTLRNYISAARRLAKIGKAAKAGKATAAKITDTPASIASEPSADEATPAEPTPINAPAPSSSKEATTESIPAPAKPKRGRPKAAAKNSLERETSIKGKPGRKPSSKEAVAQAPVPKRRKARV